MQRMAYVEFNTFENRHAGTLLKREEKETGRKLTSDTGCFKSKQLKTQKLAKNCKIQ